MSSFRQLMMRAKGLTPNPPANVVFTQAGFDNGIKLYENGNLRNYFKDTNDLAYGGFYYFQSNGNRWSIALFVSETLSGVQCTRKDQKDGSWSMPMNYSETPIYYLGKYWYYTTTGGSTSGTSTTEAQNGRYLIGNGTVYSGSDFVIDAVKDLLDYVYSYSPTTLYAPTLDGTEQITTMSGSSSPTISNNTLSGGSGYLSEGWDNTGIWTLTFKAYASSTPSDCGVYILPPTMTNRDNTEFMISGVGKTFVYIGGSAQTIDTTTYYPSINLQSWQDIKIKKTDSTTLVLEMGGVSHSYTFSTLSNYNKICIGVDSWGGVCNIKDILVIK